MMNADLTPEILEAIPKEDLRAIKSLADSLHQAVPELMATPLSAADVEREMRLRTALKLKMDEAVGWLKSQEADLAAFTRELRMKKGYCTSDEARLESLMFSRLREEKRGNS